MMARNSISKVGFIGHGHLGAGGSGSDITRRQALQGAIAASAGYVASRLLSADRCDAAGHRPRAMLVEDTKAVPSRVSRGGPATAPQAGPKVLTPFKDRLPVPLVLRPQKLADGRHAIRLHMRRAWVQLHSELPASEVWGFEGRFPGPTIEVSRGQAVEVEWVNDIQAGRQYPVLDVVAPVGTQNQPGRSGGTVRADVAALPPWTVVHLHGGRTPAYSDGWPENGLLSGQSDIYHYPNDQRATMLWYHDHALGITRLNVYAGLTGMYIMRDAEEEALHLPSGPYEIPLLIQDRNLDTTADGSLTGRLLHKLVEGSVDFFGPFTLINGIIWPHLPVEPRQYRFRLLNGANARAYRLSLLDERGKVVNDALRQIGSEGGLLSEPTPLPAEGLTLMPAERADLIVDFRAFRGRRLKLVNTAASPFAGESVTSPPGVSVPKEQLDFPEILEFRVSPQRVEDPFVLPPRLSSIQRFNLDELSRNHAQRLVALVSQGTMRMLRELAPVANPVPGEPLIEVQDERGAFTRYRTLATRFEDTTNWMVEYGSVELWHLLNLTKGTHAIHLHLVQFQVLRRDRYTTGDFDAKTGEPTAPVRFKEHGRLDANETGWKDTVRVDPGEWVSIAAKFDGFTGRYVYHCHMVEHEDHDMMRPFVVMPAAAIAAMGMTASKERAGP